MDPTLSTLQNLNKVQNKGWKFSSLKKDPPVVVGQLDVVSWHEHLAVLQPDEVRLRNPLGHASENRTAPCWFGHGLRPLQKLWRS